MSTLNIWAERLIPDNLAILPEDTMMVALGRRRMRKMKRVWTYLGIGLAGALIWLVWQLDLPHWQRLDIDKLVNVRQTTLVYDRDGRAAGSLYGSENRVVVPLSAIPADVRNAFIAAEDLRFYQHNGIDLRRIVGALLKDLQTLSFRQGASTITQQLIKLTHLTSEKTLSRKAQEAVLALRLERVMDKDDILENYLNIVYFGHGAYGIEAAANVYFDKHAAELSLAEGALLAGIVKSPSGYAPHLNPQRSVARRDNILSAMEKSGLISPEAAAQARAVPLKLAEERADAGRERYSWFLDAVLQEAQQALSGSAESVLSGGYRIYTSFDPELQKAADALYGDAESFPPPASDGTLVQSALVALDPASGEVQALVGGRSYDALRGLNRATQMLRQPGSALKPISVYAAAIDHYGFLPSSFADDSRRTFPGNYTPRNAGDAYHGQVTLREALSRSLNVATVDLAVRVGMDSVRAYAERFGIPLDRDDADLSLALGAMTYGVSPVQLAAAYASLASGGLQTQGHLIRRIENCDGRELYAYRPTGGRAVRPETAYLITDMLKTAVQSGSARALSGLEFPIAAKTGTVSMKGGGNRDAWTVAYTPDLVVCAWMGFDQPDEQHALAESDGGGSYPARLVNAYFRQVPNRLSRRDFTMPEGLRTAVIDRLALEQERRVALASANTPADFTTRDLFFATSIP